MLLIISCKKLTVKIKKEKEDEKKKNLFFFQSNRYKKKVNQITITPRQRRQKLDE